MILFICDTCSAVKQPEDVWIVGLAAEAVGAVSSRREANIQSTWTREAALHSLAVHFCSIQCKDEYMARLFGREPGEVLVERTAPAEVVIVRKVPEAEEAVTKARKVHRPKRRAS